MGEVNSKLTVKACGLVEYAGELTGDMLASWDIQALVSNNGCSSILSFLNEFEIMV